MITNKETNMYFLKTLLVERIKDVMKTQEYRNIRLDPRVAVIDAEYDRLLHAKKPYEILGIPQNATYEAAHSAYRRIMRKIHPDIVPTDLKGSVNELAQKVNAAFEFYDAKHRSKPGY